MPLQVTVGSQDGLNLRSLVEALACGYRDRQGRRVDPLIGLGATENGLPRGFVLLVPFADDD